MCVVWSTNWHLSLQTKHIKQRALIGSILSKWACYLSSLIIQTLKLSGDHTINNSYQKICLHTGWGWFWRNFCHSSNSSKAINQYIRLKVLQRKRQRSRTVTSIKWQRTTVTDYQATNARPSLADRLQMAGHLASQSTLGQLAGLASESDDWVVFSPQFLDPNKIILHIKIEFLKRAHET